MKKLSIFLVMATLGMNLSFASNFTSDPTSKLTVEIKKMLQSPKFDLGEELEARATVFFTVNNNNEIVVVDITCANNNVKTFVKKRLNYHQLKSVSLQKGKIFKMPLKIVNS